MVVDQKRWAALQHSEYLEENYDESGFKKADDVSMSIDNIPSTTNAESSIYIDESFALSESAADISAYNNCANISIISID